MRGSDKEGCRWNCECERTHRRKRRRDLQLIPRLPCWPHEGRRDVGRHASHVLAPTRHRKRTKRVGERHDQAAMHRLAIRRLC